MGRRVLVALAALSLISSGTAKASSDFTATNSDSVPSTGGVP